ncbi:MAG: RIP metalloprotease RseP [Patescibacteria group bacterium]|jgi:regulator of sigma E protease
MSVLLFIFILSGIVCLHELGHFISARRLGVRAEEFGFGFPPRIWGWRPKNSETVYTINWIPFGGFVRLKGEGGDAAEDEDSFVHKSIGRRAIIIAAGVSVNFVLAAILLVIGFWTGLPSVLNDTLPETARIADARVQIVNIEENSPAAETTLEAGDTLRMIDDVEIVRATDLRAYTAAHIGDEVTLSIERDNEIFAIQTSIAEVNGQAQIGIGLLESGLVSYPFFEAIWRGVAATADFTWQILVSFGRLVRDLVVSQTISSDVAGPIGIAAMTGQIAELGPQYLLQFVAILSLSLAVINVLPIPALDGGRLFFLFLEKIRGRAISQKAEGWIHGVGFYALILLILVISVRDFSRFGIGEAIATFFGRIF